MDLQSYFNALGEAESVTRASYHLTYGGLIDALKAAPADALFDERVSGIGSYRGYYIDIALFTEETGYYINTSKYDLFEPTNYLPINANELANVLESLIGQDFVGYKGGNFTITKDKPLWLEAYDSDCFEVAVIGIDKDLRLITRQL